MGTWNGKLTPLVGVGDVGVAILRKWVVGGEGWDWSELYTRQGEGRAGRGVGLVAKRVCDVPTPHT
jgi:hypothetical protein